MKYIKGYDSLRAISIIFVLFAHLGLKQYLPENDYVGQRVWQLMSGGTGVQIFFTLSGFLITSILLKELKEYNSIHFRFFFIRRFLRLLPPLIVLYIVIFVLMLNGSINDSGYGIIFSFFYIYNFIPNKFYTSELGHTWSLSVEEQYYFVWPFVIHFVRERKKLFLIIFAVVAVSFLSYYIYPHISFTGRFKPTRWFIPAVSSIIIGSFFGIIAFQMNPKWKELKHNNRNLLIAGIVLYLFPLYTPILQLIVVFQAVGISLILMWISLNQESKLTTLLDNKVLSYIGKLSYGLYVYHGIFIRTGPGSELWIQQFPQNVFFTVCMAIASYHFLEMPILKLKKHFRRTA